MAMQRKNPVPPGKYWVDQFEQRILEFDMWLRRNDDKVKVIKREEFARLWNGRQRVWYLFQVQQPVKWEKGWGFPTIAQSAENPTAPVVEKPDDTVTKPPPPLGPIEQLESLFEDAKTVAFIALLAYLWTQSGSKR